MNREEVLTYVTKMDKEELLDHVTKIDKKELLDYVAKTYKQDLLHYVSKIYKEDLLNYVIKTYKEELLDYVTKTNCLCEMHREETAKYINYRKRFLDHEISEEFQGSNRYVSKQTIILRIIMKWLDVLDCPIENIHELKNLSNIHRDCMNIIDEMWQESLCRTAANQDEITNFERLMSKDHAKPYDIARYLSGLSKRFRKRDLLRLLAMDGLLGGDSKNYIVNLKFSPKNKKRPTSYEEIHVRAIREIYNRFSDLEPQELSEILLNVYDEKKSSSEEDSNVAQMYLEWVDEYLSDIAQWKKDQISKEEKKNKSIEAKKPSSNKPPKKQKSKNVNKVSKKIETKKRKMDAEAKDDRDNEEIIENESKGKKVKNSKDKKEQQTSQNKKRKPDVCEEKGNKKEIIKKRFRDESGEEKIIKKKSKKRDICDESESDNEEEQEMIQTKSKKRDVCDESESDNEEEMIQTKSKKRDVCDESESDNEEEMIQTKCKKRKTDDDDDEDEENKSDESGDEEENTDVETKEESEVEYGEESDIDV